MLLGKEVEGICNRVMEEVGKCISWVDGSRDVNNCCKVRLLLDFDPPLSLLHSWTVYIAFN